jgi:hypothetical protein
VESRHDGVLHEISPNANVFTEENNASQAIGLYHLVATSVAPAAPFSGSGNIAIIRFNVTSLGHSELALETQLQIIFCLVTHQASSITATSTVLLTA